MQEKILEIDVLEEDIQLGNQDSCSNCALARAIKRRVSPYFRSDVSVGTQTFSVGIVASQELPREAVDFIERFDNDEEVAPFRFQISLPEYIVTGNFN